MQCKHACYDIHTLFIQRQEFKNSKIQKRKGKKKKEKNKKLKIENLII